MTSSLTSPFVCLYIYGYKHIDKELKLRGIDTIFYSGYDTYKCVLDKPMGIYQLKERNSNYRIIVIRDCVLSSKEIYKKVAINIIEKNFGYKPKLD